MVMVPLGEVAAVAVVHSPADEDAARVGVAVERVPAGEERVGSRAGPRGASRLPLAVPSTDPGLVAVEAAEAKVGVAVGVAAAGRILAIGAEKAQRAGGQRGGLLQGVRKPDSDAHLRRSTEEPAAEREERGPRSRDGDVVKIGGGGGAEDVGVGSRSREEMEEEEDEERISKKEEEAMSGAVAGEAGAGTTRVNVWLEARRVEGGMNQISPVEVEAGTVEAVAVGCA